ncbi:MAG TPA: hypothetical protein VKA04_05415, partial [Pseudodesulfovibrio sp.]|nr:hypothetical protein [Pseudodesulfovibrio sp.]
MSAAWADMAAHSNRDSAATRIMMRFILSSNETLGWWYPSVAPFPSGYTFPGHRFLSVVSVLNDFVHRTTVIHSLDIWKFQESSRMIQIVHFLFYAELNAVLAC